MKVMRRFGLPVLVVLGIFAAAGCGERTGVATDEPQDSSPREAAPKTEPQTGPQKDVRTPAETYGEYSKDAVVLATRSSKEPNVSTARVEAVEARIS